MSSSDMDSLVGQHMVQGLVDYVIVSLNHRPDAKLEELENEFYSFFGAAKEPVKKYFEYIRRNMKFRPSVHPKVFSIYISNIL